MRINKTVFHHFVVTVSWILLVALSVATAFIAGWVALGAIILHGTQLLGIVGVTIFSILTAGTVWLVSRFLSPLRIVLRSVGILFTILLVGEAAWSLLNPDKSLYLAREMVWNAANVWDYQRYPQRMIANGPAVYHFPANLSPKFIQALEPTTSSLGSASDFEQFLEDDHTTAFIVIHDGVVLYEKYFNGYTRDSVVPSFSMAKSFVSVLVGIAIDDGYISNLDDSLVTYVPELGGRGLENVTLRHLISMSSGIRCTRPDDQLFSIWPFNVQQMAYSYPNLRGLALTAMPGATHPGTHFDYCDYNPLLLGMILERTTHRSLSAYLSEKIWQPLGMEYPASWDLDSLKDGFEKTEVGINGRAIDFAKFGQLMLDNGAWNDKQLVPQEWVIESTAPIVNDARPYSPAGAAAWKAGGGYAKYLWWGKTRPDGSYTFMAWGAQGEFIYISPQERAVVVRFGIDAGKVSSWTDVFEAVVVQIIGKL